MSEIKINEKFKELLAPLSAEEFQELEESLLKNGLENGLMTWRGFIIDGHNRWSIIQKHNLPFHTINRDEDFETEDDVLEWIYTNQLGRRNLTNNQKTLYIGELYELRKKKHGGDRKSNEFQESKCHSDILISNSQENNSATVTELFSNQVEDFSNWNIDEPENELTYEIEPEFQKAHNQTAKQIAKEMNVSSRTVHRAASVVNAIKNLPPETKTDFLAGKITQKEVIEKAAETLSPELKQTLLKKQEIKNDAAAKWRDATYKIYLQLTSITDCGGIEKLTQNWDSERLSYWRDELRNLQLSLIHI